VRITPKVRHVKVFPKSLQYPLRVEEKDHMTIKDPATEFLFSYGTLQLESVQMATFGRVLSGLSDVLSGFAEAPLPIADEAVIAASVVSLKFAELIIGALAPFDFRNSVQRHQR
jgi:hypothetical protein